MNFKRYTAFCLFVFALLCINQPLSAEEQPQEWRVNVGEGEKIFKNKAEADAYGQEFVNKKISETTARGDAINIEGQWHGDPNAVKEAQYTDQHIVTNPDGSRHFKPDVTERTVISDRMIVNPDGSTEFWKQGIDKATQEQQEALAQHQAVLDAQRRKIYGNNPDAESKQLMEEGKVRDQQTIEEEAKKIEELKIAKEKHEQEEREKMEKEYRERYKVLKSVEPKGSE